MASSAKRGSISAAVSSLSPRPAILQTVLDEEDMAMKCGVVLNFVQRGMKGRKERKEERSKEGILRKEKRAKWFLIDVERRRKQDEGDEDALQGALYIGTLVMLSLESDGNSVFTPKAI